jgi:hypothetical protein
VQRLKLEYQSESWCPAEFVFDDVTGYFDRQSERKSHSAEFSGRRSRGWKRFAVTLQHPSGLLADLLAGGQELESMLARRYG